MDVLTYDYISGDDPCLAMGVVVPYMGRDYTSLTLALLDYLSWRLSSLLPLLSDLFIKYVPPFVAGVTDASLVFFGYVGLALSRVASLGSSTWRAWTLRSGWGARLEVSWARGLGLWDWVCSGWVFDSARVLTDVSLGMTRATGLVERASWLVSWLVGSLRGPGGRGGSRWGYNLVAALGLGSTLALGSLLAWLFL